MKVAKRKLKETFSPYKLEILIEDKIDEDRLANVLRHGRKIFGTEVNLYVEEILEALENED